MYDSIESFPYEYSASPLLIQHPPQIFKLPPNCVCVF